MPVTIQKQGNIVIIGVDGPLILGNAVNDFRAKWSEAVARGACEIVIDLRNVRRIDSSGIGSLVRCNSSITANGGRVKLVGANETIRQVFNLTRLDRVFEFHQTLEGALHSSDGSA